MNFKKRLFAVAAVLALTAAGVLISGGQNAATAGPGATPVSIVSPLPYPQPARPRSRAQLELRNPARGASMSPIRPR